MSTLRPSTVIPLLRRLHAGGFMLWHNRGKLLCAPLSRLSPEDAAILGLCKLDVIEALKRWGWPCNAPEDLVAPCAPGRGSYAGALLRPPWAYEVAVILPHFGDVDLLDAAIACWRRQTVSPYLVIVNTGGVASPYARLEQRRSWDTEIHYIASNGWYHSSSPVAAALDLAFAVCQQRCALLTHVDVFPRVETLLEDLLGRLTPSCPVVGYQMSPRIGGAEWSKCVSHTLTMVDLQAMRRHGITWNLLAALEEDNEVEQRFLGWPDTETWFGRRLRAVGIVPEFLGPESNAPVYATDLIVHWRSAPSVRHYYPDQTEQRHPGLSAWLALTRAAGLAAELPHQVLRDQLAGDQVVAGDVAGDGSQHPAEGTAVARDKPGPGEPG